MERTRDEPKWPRLLALSVHEFRTPMTVVAGYIRMLLNNRAGALKDEQRRLLEEAERSCVRLSALLAEMSDLSNLEAGTATFNRSATDLSALIAGTIAALPAVPDREITVSFARGHGEGATVTGDPVRLRAAFTAVLNALRRELVTSTELFVRQRAGDYNGQPATWIAFGDAGHIEALTAAGEDALATFDEWRGGCGLGLAVARRVLNAHGGAIWSPADGAKAGAVVVLPTA
jgi:signal transduction histidine kinase